MTAPVTWTPTAAAALARLKGRLFATVTESAAVLEQDPRTVRKAIVAGEIPFARAGVNYRVPVAWLLQQAGLGAENGAAGAP